MNANVGGLDKKARMAVGAIILALGAVYESWWGLVGLVPLATGLINFCPLYPMIGLNTAKGSDDAEKPAG